MARTILIHGCASKDNSLSREGKKRCDSALNIVKDGDTIILMGGKIKAFHLHSEAELMQKYITKKLPQHHVLYSIRLETASSTTIHNAEEALRLYGGIIDQSEDLIMITSQYHARRTRLIWKFLLKKRPFRMETCVSSTQDFLRSLPIEIAGIIITHLYFHGKKWPELKFRELYRTPKKAKP